MPSLHLPSRWMLLTLICLGLSVNSAPASSRSRIPKYDRDIEGCSSEPWLYTQDSQSSLDSQFKNLNIQAGHSRGSATQSQISDPWDQTIEKANAISAFRQKHRNSVQECIDAKFKLGGKEEEEYQKKRTWSKVPNVYRKKREPVKYMNFGKSTPNIDWMSRFPDLDLDLIHENYARETGNNDPSEEMLLRYGNWNIGYALISQRERHHQLAIEHLHRCQEAEEHDIDINDLYGEFDPSITYTPVSTVVTMHM